MTNNIKPAILLAIFLLSVSYGQKVYFVKYSEQVPLETIRQACQTQKIFRTSSKPNNGPQQAMRITNIAEKFAITDARLQRIWKIVLPSDMSSEQFRESLSPELPVDYFEASHVYKVDSVPNDSLFAKQWALKKIDALSAWNITTGDTSLIIGIVDTGIDYTHPDLMHKIFYNEGELGLDEQGRDKRFNGVDDDHDGFIDDYMGWDFTNRVGYPADTLGGDFLDWDNNPMDDNAYSHGTAVAGIIGAETNNALGIAGVAPGVKLLNCRAFDPTGNANEEDAASAILYATMMGARVINMSFGDNSFSYVLRDVIRYAYSKNVVLVASSGNDGTMDPHYPSGYSEVISVGNSTEEDYVASTSSHGSTLDLIAPGTAIITTAKGYHYQSFDGTSAAAPFVSAAAGLILSVKNFSNEEVKQVIKSTCDDNGQAGWDLMSGAGRLNLGRALRVLAPATVKFTYPYQDFATAMDTLQISGTILSAYFTGFSLFYGLGLNPTDWKPLLVDQLSQREQKLLATLDLSAYGDTIFTLRLVVQQNNGNTLEERINVRRTKKPITGELITLMPAMYGNHSTLVAATYSREQGIAKMFYREAGTSDFQFVSLDGLSPNTFFVRSTHYGFIPLSVAKPNTDYEIYFEFEDLLGNKTVLTDSTQPLPGHYFLNKTGGSVFNLPVTDLPYSPGNGQLFGMTFNLTTGTANSSLLFNNMGYDSIAFLYSFQNNAFVLQDSILKRIPKDVGDFNGNGKLDLLTNWGRNLYMLEQETAGGTKFIQKYKRENLNTWPIMVADLNGNGQKQVLAFTNDTTISVFRVNADLSIDSISSGQNFAKREFGKGIFDTPHAVVTDIDNNGQKEVWVADTFGNVLCFNVGPNNSLVPDTIRSFNTSFMSSSSFLAAGDFNGDGKTDIAVLLHSIDSDIAKFYLLGVLSFTDGTPKMIYEKVFIDPTAEFNLFTRKTYNSMKFIDVDGDSKEELVLCTYPYSYILKYDPIDNHDVIRYMENVNANSVLAGDFNNDGSTDIGIPTSFGIKFIQFTRGSTMVRPGDLSGFSADSISINLTWQGNASKYYIYRSDSTGFLLIDSVSFKTSYVDRNHLTLNKNYRYMISVKSGDGTELSSDKLTVFHHKPAIVESISVSAKGRSVTVVFSNRVETKVTNLTYFHLLDSAGTQYFPTSVTVASQNTYQVAFNAGLLKGNYRFLIGGMKDFYGSLIPSDTLTFSFIDLPVKQEFFIESFKIMNPYLLQIKFNLPVDAATALSTENYRFNPYNEVKRITFVGNDSTRLLLSMEGARPIGSVGIEYTLQITGIHSSAETGSVPIKINSGSVIQLTTYAGDLDKIYVYPNPVRPNKSEKMTFANLPKYAEIHIYSLSGKSICTLNEVDGNGGIDWDLRGDDGKQISTGVYIYLVRQFNEIHEEIATKLEKFTVIR